MGAPADDVLDVRGLSVSRGEVPVVHEVSLGVAPGTVTVLLGANGAGKTTLLDGIAGLAPAAGTVALAGTPLTGLPTYRRAQAGLGYAEQARTVFRTLTLEQNLLVSGDGDPAMVYDIFPELDRRRTLPAANLSGGEQQMLVIGRALIAGPKVVLIDEMSLGLAPVVVRRLMGSVRELAERGIGVLLVEQFANLALEIGARAYVLRKGRVVFEGPCEELRGAQDRLHEFYFGAVTDDGLARAAGTEGGS
ncbi:ABC transporter ATP-binding protein [Nonomuraea sp. NPDC001023]|uniref:ABC transporter ATP-binding protein n=1 Tax=unclassified Nonomuraea TaxID=2593643 RepID=UPI00331F2615